MDATTHRRPATSRPPLLEGDHRETEGVARDRKTGAGRQRGVMTPRLGAPAVPFQRESSHAFGTASHGALTILHGVKALMVVYAGLLRRGRALRVVRLQRDEHGTGRLLWPSAS